MTDFFNNHKIVIIISLIWGFGLALLFRKYCKNDECNIIQVPNNFNNTNQTIYNNNKCYSLNKYFVQCE